MSIFITFEGGEGCGKSTQVKALYKKLSMLGVPVTMTHEPGGTTLGKELRGLLKKRGETDISPEAELFLFVASRAQLVSEVIHPKLRLGTVVICDRFADSTVAYQGYGRQIDLTIVRAIIDLATRGIKPDLTILLDIPIAEGLARKKRSSQDRFESEEIEFHNRVREGYLKLAAQEPKRWLVIDASLPRVKTSKLIWNRVEQLLMARNILGHA